VKKQKSLTRVLLVIFFLLVPGIYPVYGDDPAPPIRSCERINQRPNYVTITEPKDGANVGQSYIIKGKSDVRDGSQIFVLIHVKQLTEQWWPQNKPIVQADGSWEAFGTFGGQQDIGRNFEIAVATFTGEDLKKIEKYRYIGQSTNQWLPIQFPETTSNVCVITVKKTE
jgi:hypothetical protein